MRALALATSMLLAMISIQSSAATPRAEESSYRFLVSARTQGGVLNDDSLPLSFIDSADYWGSYLCKLPQHSCAVHDIYNSADYSLTPEPGAAGELQVERVNVHNGVNIYDAATWQIAVMLGHVVNGFASPANQDAYALVSKPASTLSDKARRATTRGEVFKYNGVSINEVEQAYAFRMIARAWLVDDPFKDTRYEDWLSVDQLPANSDYQRGKLSWLDWKPITGENAWAFLIGPLQAAYIHYVLDRKQGFVPFNDVAVQGALKILPGFAAMQSPLGAVYYAPAGTAGQRDKSVVNPHEVSVENNISLYAGLKILDATLRKTMASSTNLNAADKGLIGASLQTIDVMIHGGRVGPQSTAGLLSFFKHNAWVKGEFVQGGIANDSQQRDVWVPTLAPKAVDVNTWGVAALGASRIDEWFGFGAAYKNWQQVKTWGAYGRGASLWGVGYSEQDGNGMQSDGSYRAGVLSAEWTFGAINMVRSLLRHYRNVASDSPHYLSAQHYVEALKADEAAMLKGVQSLMFENYRHTDFTGKPESFDRLISQRYRSYLYASRRYLIPFGWYANPLPSTCATAWALMVADGFDPLSYAGGRR